MERAAREKRGSRKSNSWADNAQVFDCHNGALDYRFRNWGLGGRSYRFNRSRNPRLRSNGANQMIEMFQKVTDYMCYGILAFCFAASFFTGAYNHVMKEIAMESLLKVSIAQLMNVEVRV